MATNNNICQFIKLHLSPDEREIVEISMLLEMAIENKYQDYSHSDNCYALLRDVILDNIVVSPCIDKKNPNIKFYLEDVAGNLVDDLRNCKEIEELLLKLKSKYS